VSRLSHGFCFFYLCSEFEVKGLKDQVKLINGVSGEWHLLKQYCYKKTYFRHSGAGRNPGNEAIDSDSWIPACAGMTVVLA
jgi:hypothetical protein